MKDQLGARATSFLTASRAEQWLFDGIQHIGDIFDNDNKKTLRKIKAVVELLFWEMHVVAHPSQRIINELRKILETSNASGKLIEYFWRHLETDTLARVCIGLMAQLDLIPKNDPMATTTLCFLDWTYHEMLPFRNLDVEHARYKFSKIQNQHIASQSPVQFYGHLPPRILSDEYALTHTIFYLTDFGKNTEIFFPFRADLVIRLESLSAEALLTNNLDILAEHLLALRHLDAEDQTSAIWYASEVCARIERDGYWRGPLDLRSQLRKEGFTKNMQIFFENYHTTLLLRDFLLGLSCPSTSTAAPVSHLCKQVPAKSTTHDTNNGCSKPSKPVVDLETFKKILSCSSFNETKLIEQLTHAGCIQIFLMAYLRMLKKRGSLEIGLPKNPRIAITIDQLARGRMRYRNANFLLTQMISRCIVELPHGSLSNRDWQNHRRRLDSIEKSYLLIINSNPVDDESRTTLLTKATELICSAAALCAHIKLDPPMFLRIGIQGAIHQAIRYRDIVNMCYALWAGDICGFKVDHYAYRLAQLVIDASRVSHESPTSETSRVISLAIEMSTSMVAGET